MRRIAFIGAGNMGGALVRSICTVTSPDLVVVSDSSAELAAAVSEETGCALATDNCGAAMGAKFVVLCVKPQVLPSVLEEIAPYITEGQVLVSIAAGITIDSMTAVLARFGKSIPVIRVITNMPAAIGQGLILLAPGKDVREPDLLLLEELFTPCGRVERTEEKYADALMVVGGCVPAFAYVFIEAIADGAVATGLPRDKAQLYAAQSILGAAAMVLETGRHPGELKDAVCSPGGSTIVGVGTLESHGFRAAAAGAVKDAFRRTVELGAN